MERIPNTKPYKIFLTIIIAISILWVIFNIIPNIHYNVYYVKK